MTSIPSNNTEGKKCPQCKEIKPLANFGIYHKLQKDGTERLCYRPNCKECQNRINHEKSTRSRANTLSSAQKQCTKCEQWKPATREFFHIHSTGLYGLNTVCRQCKSLRTTPLPEPVMEGYKKCYSCKEIKLVDEFSKNRAQRDGRSTACKACAKIHNHTVTDRRRERNEAITEKQCLRCEQTKVIIDFPQDSNSYYRNVCKACKNEERRLRIPGQVRIPEEKRCPWCKQVKPIKEYTLNSQRRDGHSTYCRDCENVRKQVKGTGQGRQSISRDEHSKKLQEQDEKCAICNTHAKRRKLHLDHNHQTGQIRDFLCSNCNTALGMLKEDPEIIKSLLQYIEKWNNTEEA